MISILIPTYNYDVFPLVENIFRQCKKKEIEFEILVVDDCSTEEIIIEKNSEIRNFQHVFLFRNEINLGRTQTRELLAKEARYNWLLFLDSDVIPAQGNFISEYIKATQAEFKVVLGGCTYRSFNLDSSTFFRWKYGSLREEATAKKRNQHPYGYVLSANILIDKKVFLENNFQKKQNVYGMDIYFSYNLFRNNLAVLHIDNPVIHLGLEQNEVFFNKSLESIKSRKLFLADKDDIGKVNSLLKHYNRLRKWKLTGIVSFAFKISESFLKKRILSENSNLFLFDLYRLGYICTVK